MTDLFKLKSAMQRLEKENNDDIEQELENERTGILKETEAPTIECQDNESISSMLEEPGSGDKSFEDDMNEDEIKTGRRSYFAIHQAQRKRDNLFLFIYYSAATNSWLCKVCSEYNKRDKYWRTKGVKLHEHRLFSNHLLSRKHKDSLTKEQ